jgi:hypothetical protein
MFNILSAKCLMVQHFCSRVGCGHQLQSSSHSICCGFGSSGPNAAGGCISALMRMYRRQT